jgi:Tfp pilus assembly protein PilF
MVEDNSDDAKILTKRNIRLFSNLLTLDMTKRIIHCICLASLAILSGCARFPNVTGSALVLDAEKGLSATNEQDAEFRFGLARLTERNGSPSDARKAYEKILQEDPKHTGARHRLAIVIMKQGQVAEALDHFRLAVESAPTASAELLGDYGYALYLSNDLDQAETQLFRAVKLDPSDKRTVNNLAIVSGMQGDFARSAELFRSIHPDSEAMANLAFIQSQAGQISKAKKSYHLALGMDPTLKVAATGLMEIHQSGLTTETDSRVVPAADRVASRADFRTTNSRDYQTDSRHYQTDRNSLARSARNPGQRDTGARYDHEVRPVAFYEDVEQVSPRRQRQYVGGDRESLPMIRSITDSRSDPTETRPVRHEISRSRNVTSLDHTGQEIERTLLKDGIRRVKRSPSSAFEVEAKLPRPEFESKLNTAQPSAQPVSNRDSNRNTKGSSISVDPRLRSQDHSNN